MAENTDILNALRQDCSMKTKPNKYTQCSIDQLQFLEGIGIVLQQRFHCFALKPELALIRNELARRRALLPETIDSTRPTNKDARIGY